MNAIEAAFAPQEQQLGSGEAASAQDYISAILSISDDPALVPGDLCGMSQFLENARRVLFEATGTAPL